MNWVELITAVGGLGMLVLGIALILAMILFRTEIKVLVRNLTNVKVKRGDTEFSINQAIKELEEIKEVQTKEEISAEKVASESSAVLEQSERAGDEHPRGPMIEAFFAGNIKEGEAAYTKLQADETDAVAKLKNEALYLALRFRTGDTSVFEKYQDLLKRSAGSKEGCAAVNFWMAFSYQEAGNFDRAAQYFKVSQEMATSDQARADAVVHYVDCLFQGGQENEAYSAIMNSIVNTTEPAALSSLYAGLADLYHKAGIWDLRAIAFEKAIENKPNDYNLRFGAGYAYSQKEFESLAMLHYQALLRFKPDYSLALNNLGVQYKNLGMPIKAVHHYKSASKLGETLASANLANILISNGFLDEARTILNEAKQKDDAHRNVANAIASIAKEQQAEEDVEDRVLKAAREQQRFLSRFAEAYFAKSSVDLLLNGQWKFPNDTVVTIEQVGKKVQAQWTYQGTESKITGSVSNRGAILDFKEGVYSITTYQGYAYVSENGQQLFIMRIHENDQSFMTLTKHNQNETV